MSNLTPGGYDLKSLSMTGFRIGPLDTDPKYKGQYRITGKEDELKKNIPPNYHRETVFVKKTRAGFGGGFKIPEEYRKAKMHRKSKKRGDQSKSESDEGKDENLITKEEIFAHLNLGNAEGGIGAGKYGNNSKQALANDLIDGITKDLEKLKRVEENIRIRKLLTQKGGKEIVDETDKDREMIRQNDLFDEAIAEGAGPLVVNERRHQVFRHKAGQLDSLKQLDWEELESQRLEQKKKLQILEEAYWRQREGTVQGKLMKQRLNFVAPPADGKNSEEKQIQKDEQTFTFGQDDDQKGRSRKRPQTGKTRDAADDLFVQGKQAYGKENADIFNKSERSAKRKESRSNRFADEDDVGAGLKTKKSVKIMEPGFETGPIRREERDQNKPLKSALSRSRGRAEGSENEDGDDYDNDASEVTKESRRGRYNNQKNAWYEPEALKNSQISPRRKVYEAKYEKFLANKRQSDTIQRRSASLKQPSFDVTTKGKDSPSKRTANYKGVVGAEIKMRPSGKYEPDELMPAGYEQHLMREELLSGKKQDPFKLLGVSAEDKMTFFLLKWVFNAIKQNSDEDDPKLKGKKYMKKAELQQQLSKNAELMEALGITTTKELNQKVKAAPCAKVGCLTWEEFLGFFFLKDGNLLDYTEGNWWNNLDENGNRIVKEAEKKASSKKSAEISDFRDDESSGNKMSKKGRKFLAELKEVPMTPALEMLLKTRRIKTEQEVEEDFKNMQEQKMLDGGQPVAKNKTATKQNALLIDPLAQDNLTDALNKREKAKCLLLPSQIQTMKEIYEALDKYDDKILKRSDYLMRLRTDDKVVDFIDVDAVSIPHSKKILTLDQILAEIERDEMFEMTQLSKLDDAINHKEFITWREFLNYFEDYRDIDERNKKAKQIEKTRESLTKKTGDAPVDREQEFKTLLQQEKENRLLLLPQIRPADQIDITEQQLQLFKDIFDKTKGNQPALGTTNFFMAVRNNPDFRKIKTALARDPEGTSRIPAETFQAVIDRMEHTIQAKTIDWHLIVEFFTKRGRPLTQEEIKKLQDEDKRIKEEENERKRAFEDAEKRRMTRLMEEIEAEKEDDYEDQEKRIQEEQRRRRQEEDEAYGDEYDDEPISQDEESDEEFERMSDDDPYSRSEGQQRGRKQKQLPRTKSEDLRRQSVTAEDYLRNNKSAGPKKKGKYGVTVPLPFKFDTREAVKPKTIRERKVEAMVMEKEMEEKSMMTNQFRCKPIPAAVLVPRYQQIQDKNEERRLKVKQQSLEITKQREQPFSFWERDKAKMEAKRNADPDAGLDPECKRPSFKANKIPVACTIPMYESKIKKEEEERAKRINSQAKINQAKARMPSRMQQDADNKKQNPKELKREEFSFKPQINEPKTASMFKKMQDKFLEKLNKRKGEFVPVTPKSPNFQKTKSKPLEREYLNEGEGLPGQTEDKFKAALGKIQSTASQKAVKPPSSTRAVELAQKRRREEMEMKKAQEEENSKMDQDRIEQQNRLKKDFQARMKDSMMSATQEIERKAKEKRDAARLDEQRVKERLAAAVEKGRQRDYISAPSKVDTTMGKNLALIKGIKNALAIKVECGMTEKQARDGLTADQKLALEEHEFIEAQKKSKQAIEGRRN